MKLAITVISDSGRVSPVFETAEKLRTIRLCRSGEFSVINESSLPKDEEEKITFLRQSGVRLLICGAISNETLAELHHASIRVIPFVSGAWDRVIAETAKESSCDCLPADLVMPGCCNHHKKCCQIYGGSKNENCINKSR